MKEIYFTEDTINSKSHEILESTVVRSNITFEFRPEYAALLILDMQKYFLNCESHAYVPSALPIVNYIKQLACRFNEAGRPVIATLHTNTPDDAGLMGVWWKELLASDNHLAQITDDLKDLPGEIISKTRYDAFQDTRLEESLLESNTKQVVITGVMTHLCCETTARSAFMRGFEVFFPIDGTATYNEAFHRASCLNISHGFGHCTLTGILSENFRGYKSE